MAFVNNFGMLVNSEKLAQTWTNILYIMLQSKLQTFKAKFKVFDEDHFLMSIFRNVWSSIFCIREWSQKFIDNSLGVLKVSYSHEKEKNPLKIWRHSSNILIARNKFLEKNSIYLINLFLIININLDFVRINLQVKVLRIMFS